MIPRDCEDCRTKIPDWLDGSLDEPTSARVSSHIEGCPDCRAEHEWLLGFTHDLEALGDSLLADVPEVDLVDTVMARLGEVQEAPPNVVPFRTRQTHNSRRWVGIVAAAAAVVFVVGSLVLTGRLNPPTNIAKGPGASDGRPTGTRPGIDPQTNALLQELEKGRQAVATKLEAVQSIAPSTESEQEMMASTAAPELASLTSREIANEKRKGLTDPEARAQLVRWASLTREMARKVVNAPDADPAAVVAAAQTLDFQEAEPILLAAVGHHPEDPYLHMAAARKQMTDPSADPTPQLQAVRQTDAENALPLYSEAQVQLANGNLAEALSLLADAKGLTEASAYTLESAQSQAAALQASGMDPQAARLLTALTAGTGEYNYLCDLADNLIRYGQAYAEQGLSQEAQQIFEAVQQLGLQVQSGADFSTEQLAGLDIQQQAVDSLAGLYNQLGLQSTDSVRTLVQQTESLLGGITELGTFFDQLDELLTGDDAALSRIADVILREGDLNIFEVLFGTGSQNGAIN